jgi:DNA-binding response OmpR family regulator
MKNIILCSSNPLLIKSLYGILRDEGYAVELCEHPSNAVQLIMQKHYDLIIVDSEPFGLSTEDAVTIMRKIAPAMPVLKVGDADQELRERLTSLAAPLDLEAFKSTIHRIAV